MKQQEFALRVEEPLRRVFALLVVLLPKLGSLVLRPFDPSIERIPRHRSVAAAAMFGAFGSVLVAFGASQVSSPFSFKGVPFAWYFGVPQPSPSPTVITQTSSAAAVAGVPCFLLGMVAMMYAWIWLQRLRERNGISYGALGLTFLAWLAPILVIAPIFSRDVYAYVAQGEMASHHISPYLYGPGVLGTGNPYTLLTDPVWRQSPSPYGPLFLQLDSWLVSATQHAELPTVILLRLLAVAGLLLACVGVALIARRYGRNPQRAVMLVALNPLLLLQVVGGAHNDALMAGLLVLGVAAAVWNRPLIGIVLCTLATEIKAPAALGVLFIGWTCLVNRGERRTRQLAGLGMSFLLSLALMEAVSSATGLGWAWIKGLSNADAGMAHRWIYPSSGLAMLFAKILGGINLSGLDHPVSTLTRYLGMLTAVAIVVVLLRFVERVGLVESIGLSMLAVAVFGPAVQPWYLAWTAMVIAPVVADRSLAGYSLGCSVSCFLGVPLGAVIVNQVEGDPAWVTAGFSLIALVGVGFLVPRVLRLARSINLLAIPRPRTREISLET